MNVYRLSLLPPADQATDGWTQDVRAETEDAARAAVLAHHPGARIDACDLLRTIAPATPAATEGGVQ